MVNAIRTAACNNIMILENDQQHQYTMHQKFKVLILYLMVQLVQQQYVQQTQSIIFCSFLCLTCFQLWNTLAQYVFDVNSKLQHLSLTTLVSTGCHEVSNQPKEKKLIYSRLLTKRDNRESFNNYTSKHAYLCR